MLLGTISRGLLFWGAPDNHRNLEDNFEDVTSLDRVTTQDSGGPARDVHEHLIFSVIPHFGRSLCLGMPDVGTFTGARREFASSRGSYIRNFCGFEDIFWLPVSTEFPGMFDNIHPPGQTSFPFRAQLPSCRAPFGFGKGSILITRLRKNHLQIRRAKGRRSVFFFFQNQPAKCARKTPAGPGTPCF